MYGFMAESKPLFMRLLNRSSKLNRMGFPKETMRSVDPVDAVLFRGENHWMASYFFGCLVVQSAKSRVMHRLPKCPISNRQLLRYD